MPAEDLDVLDQLTGGHWAYRLRCNLEWMTRYADGIKVAPRSDKRGIHEHTGRGWQWPLENILEAIVELKASGLLDKDAIPTLDGAALQFNGSTVSLSELQVRLAKILLDNFREEVGLDEIRQYVYAGQVNEPQALHKLVARLDEKHGEVGMTGEKRAGLWKMVPVGETRRDWKTIIDRHSPFASHQ